MIVDNISDYLSHALCCHNNREVDITDLWIPDNEDDDKDNEYM